MQTIPGRRIWVSLLAIIAILVFISFTRTDSASSQTSKTDSAASFSEKIEKEIPVKLAKVTSEKFRSSINVYAKVEAFQSAFVAPKVAGTIENLFVDEGSRVEKGKTKLFEIDNIKLQQKVANARENIPLVLAVEKERKALLKKAQIDYDKKLKTFNRFKALFEKKAVSQEVFDTHEASLQTAEAEVEHKKAVLELGQAEAKQAKINLQMAEKDLADSIVYAPIDGYISEKLVEIGEMGQTGKPAFRIENTDRLFISAFVPAEHSKDVFAGKSTAELSSNGKIIISELLVSYVSPVIDSKLHIFEIKCLIENNDQELKPGQSVQLRIFTGEKSAATVPAAALVENSAECCLYTVENGRARKIPVRKGSEQNGRTEILEPQLKPDSRIICEGQLLLKDNAPVTIVE